MVIGIDIDDTITETSKIANEYLNNEENIFIADYHKLAKSDFTKFLYKYHKNIISNAKLFSGALQVINRLHTLGHKIIFITARGTDGMIHSIPLTSIYFAKYNIYFDKIVFAKKEKGTTAKKLGIDIFIDDKEIVLDEVKNRGIKTLRMCPMNTKSNHLKVHSWQEIEKYILSLGEE